MRLLSPAICSTRFWAKSRFSFIGSTIVPKGLSIFRSEKSSASMSESPTRTTDVSTLDSFKKPAAFVATLLVLPESVVSGGSPSGKAVLNFPVRRMASLYSTPVGLKPFMMLLSPPMPAIKLSASSATLELWSRTVSLRPAAGSPVNAPAIGSQRVSISLVTMSLRLMPSVVRPSHAGASAGWPFCPRNCILKFKSATTLPVSN